VQRLRRLGLEVEVIDEADDEAAVRELTAYLVRNEIDLLHAHMYRAEVVGARAAVAAGTAVVMATVHSSRVRSPDDVATLAALTPVMDRLIVPSSSILAKVSGEGRGGASFTVIPNGVDLARFDLPLAACALRREFGIPGGAPVLGVVARLEPEKGHRYLIEAMPAILRGAPETWLVIVGEGSLDASLRGLAASLLGPAARRIVFTGRREDVAAITAEIDVAVLPSLREAQGISILEAMARRKPVVASAVGGIPEVLTNGLHGLLVPPADPLALAEACIRLACSPSLRSRMGEAGRATVEARFSLDAMVRQIEAIYDEELVRAGALPPERSPARGGGAQPTGRATLEVPPL
jgi:glycosyltransferase involved in cell wall biosynthesis